MALTFTASSTDVVDVGSGGNLDGLEVWTFLAWIRPTSLGADQQIFSKMSGSYQGKDMYLPDGTGDIGFFQYRGGSAQGARSSDTPLSNNAWAFVGCQYDLNGADADQKLFYGDLSTPVAEVGSYSSQSVGTGSLNHATTASMALGNLGDGSGPQTWAVFKGDIAWAGMWNIYLTDAQILAQQFLQRWTGANQVFNMHLGLSGGATGAQPDWTPSRNHGTATGTALAPHPPIPIFPYKIWSPDIPSGQAKYVTITDTIGLTDTSTLYVHTVAHPDGDISINSWTNELGQSTNLYQSIDEVVPSDSDYIISPYSPTAQVYECSLEDVSDPLVSGSHRISYRYKKVGTATINLTVRLMQGASGVAMWNHNDIATTTVQVEQTLSGAEANSITDYTDLRIRFEATKV